GLSDGWCLFAGAGKFYSGFCCGLGVLTPALAWGLLWGLLGLRGSRFGILSEGLGMALGSSPPLRAPALVRGFLYLSGEFGCSDAGAVFTATLCVGHGMIHKSSPTRQPMDQFTRSHP